MSKRFQLLFAGGLLMAGCSGTIVRPSATDLQEGINLLDVRDPGFGMSAAFKEQGRVVYVESRVGSLKPEIYRNDSPDAPANEMDVRFVDSTNDTFFAVRGGDSFIDPTWTQEIQAAKQHKVDPAARALDFKLAQKAAAALQVALPASFKDHIYHAALYAKVPTPAEDPVLKRAELQLAKAPPTAPTNDQAYSTYYSGGPVTYWVGKYSGTTGCFFWTCARHSATDIWSCDWNGSGCNWNRRIVANNHGRGPWDSGMGYDCQSQGGWQYNNIDGSTASGATGWWDGAGACQSGYSWSSNNNAHLCNDDAAYELFSAKYGPQNNVSFWENSSGGWGSDYKGFGNFSCSYPSGDWNTPNCP